MIDETEMLETDYRELSRSDVLVLLAMNRDGPLSNYRVHKVVFIYLVLFRPDLLGEGPRVLDCYLDDIAESATDFTDMGVLKGEWTNYILTDYGKRLRRMVVDGYDDRDMVRIVGNIAESVSEIPDDPLGYLVYRLCGDLVIDPYASAAAEQSNRTAVLDGIPLVDIDRQSLADRLCDGTPIRWG